MAIFNISNAKSEGQLGAADTRAVFRSSGTSFILNLGSTDDLEFFIRPREEDYIDCYGTDSTVVVKDADKTATGLVLNDGDELYIDTSNVVSIPDTRFFFSISGEADQIFSDTGNPVYFDTALSNVCSAGFGCPSCPPGSGRLFENLTGKLVNLETTDFYEKDQAAKISSPGFTVPGFITINSGFVLLHNTTSDLDTTSTPTFVVDHEIGLAEEENAGDFPVLTNWYSDQVGPINRDPFFGELSDEIPSAENIKQVYLPSTVGHRGLMFRFFRQFNPGGMDNDYYACMSYNPDTNTLTLVPEDLPALKKEAGADGDGANSESYLDTEQFKRMNAVSGTGTAADPYIVDLATNILDVDFTTSGDVDNIVYFAFNLNFDEFLPIIEPEGYVFSVTTAPPPLNKNNVITRINLYGQPNFTALIGSVSGNFLQEPGHSTIFNTAFSDSDTVYVTVEKEGGGVLTNDATRVYFTQGRKEFADGDSGFTGQSLLPGTGVPLDPYQLTWEVVSGNFSFAMGTSPIYFVCNVQDDNFSMETFPVTNDYLTTGDTLIEYYGTDSTYTSLISSDDNGSMNPPLSKLDESLPGSPQNIYFTVDVGSGGALDEDREGYRVRVGQGSAAGPPGGNFVLLPDTSTLPGTGTELDCWQVAWNTIIEDIDFSEAGGIGEYYFCVSGYTATSTPVTHLQNSIDIKATRSTNGGSSGGFGDAINSGVAVFDDSGFSNQVFSDELNGSGGFDGKFQGIWDDNERKVERYGQSDFAEGDTIYVRLDASSAGGGYGYGYGGGGASTFQAIFRSVQVEQRRVISDLVGDGSEGNPYQIPYSDFFSVDLVSFDDGNVTDEVNFVVTNWQTTGAGSDFNDDSLIFHTSYNSPYDEFPDTRIIYYGTDSTYTTVQDDNDDGFGSSLFSRIDVFSQTNGTNHYFKILDVNNLGPGSGENFRVTARREPSIVFDAFNLF